MRWKPLAEEVLFLSTSSWRWSLQQLPSQRDHAPKQMALQVKTHSHTQTHKGELRAARSSKNTTCTAGIIPFEVKPREHREHLRNASAVGGPWGPLLPSHSGNAILSRSADGPTTHLHTLASPLKVLIIRGHVLFEDKCPNLLEIRPQLVFIQ